MTATYAVFFLDNGETPLYSASSWGYLEVVRAPLAAGADENKSGLFRVNTDHLEISPPLYMSVHCL